MREKPEVARIEPNPERFESTRGWGRRTWHREAHTELIRRREQAAEPIAASRPARLLEAAHRLEENQLVEIQASEAYERGRPSGGPARCLVVGSGCHLSLTHRPRCLTG